MQPMRRQDGLESSPLSKRSTTTAIFFPCRQKSPAAVSAADKPLPSFSPLCPCTGRNRLPLCCA